MSDANPPGRRRDGCAMGSSFHEWRKGQVAPGAKSTLGPRGRHTCQARLFAHPTRPTFPRSPVHLEFPNPSASTFPAEGSCHARKPYPHKSSIARFNNAVRPESMHVWDRSNHIWDMTAYGCCIQKHYNGVRTWPYRQALPHLIAGHFKPDPHHRFAVMTIVVQQRELPPPAAPVESVSMPQANLTTCLLLMSLRCP